MSRYSVLAVDLNEDVPADKRSKFYEKLTQLKWKRIPELTTLWRATWDDDGSADGIVQTTKADVQAAAKAAGIQHYDACVAVCEKPVVWTV